MGKMVQKAPKNPLKKGRNTEKPKRNIKFTLILKIATKKNP